MTILGPFPLPAPAPAVAPGIVMLPPPPWWGPQWQQHQQQQQAGDVNVDVDSGVGFSRVDSSILNLDDPDVRERLRSLLAMERSLDDWKARRKARRDRQRDRHVHRHRDYRQQDKKEFPLIESGKQPTNQGATIVYSPQDSATPATAGPPPPPPPLQLAPPKNSAQEPNVGSFPMPWRSGYSIVRNSRNSRNSHPPAAPQVVPLSENVGSFSVGNNFHYHSGRGMELEPQPQPQPTALQPPPQLQPQSQSQSPRRHRPRRHESLLAHMPFVEELRYVDEQRRQQPQAQAQRVTRWSPWWRGADPSYPVEYQTAQMAIVTGDDAAAAAATAVKPSLAGPSSSAVELGEVSTSAIEQQHSNDPHHRHQHQQHRRRSSMRESVYLEKGYGYGDGDGDATTEEDSSVKNTVDSGGSLGGRALGEDQLAVHAAAHPPHPPSHSMAGDTTMTITMPMPMPMPMTTPMDPTDAEQEEADVARHWAKVSQSKLGRRLDLGLAPPLNSYHEQDQMEEEAEEVGQRDGGNRSVETLDSRPPRRGHRPPRRWFRWWW